MSNYLIVPENKINNQEYSIPVDDIICIVDATGENPDSEPVVDIYYKQLSTQYAVNDQVVRYLTRTRVQGLKYLGTREQFKGTVCEAVMKSMAEPNSLNELKFARFGESGQLVQVIQPFPQ